MTPPRRVRVLKPCGTVAAYRRHRTRGEDACTACKKAMALDGQERRANPPQRPRKLAPCGTYGGAQRHAKRGEDLCPPCVVARRTYKAEHEAKARSERRARSAALDLMLAEILAETPVPCGTINPRKRDQDGR